MDSKGYILCCIVVLFLVDIIVESFDPECYLNERGLDYRGNRSTTQLGQTCQHWTAQNPHQHRHNPTNFPDAGLGDHNYCRNPDEDVRGPWCYTHSGSRWEYCDVGDPSLACNYMDCMLLQEMEFGRLDPGQIGVPLESLERPDGSIDNECNELFCVYPLGMEDHRIRDHQLSSSSDLDAQHTARYARYKMVPHAWSAGKEHNDQNQWIQVDLLRNHIVSGVVLQGRMVPNNSPCHRHDGSHEPSCHEWVTKYKVKYKLHGSPWHVVKNDRMEDAIFQGNHDRNTAVKSFFYRQVIGRYIKIVPWEWHNNISMRFELLGCPEEEDFVQPDVALPLHLITTTVTTKTTKANQGSFRLEDGSGPHEGRVEFYNVDTDAWGTICGDSWNYKAAMVVCRELGFDQVKQVTNMGTFGRGSGPIYFEGLHCLGNETTLLDCSYKELLRQDCSHDEDAGVTCLSDKPERFDHIRLTKGHSPNKGRVEIQHGDIWSSICGTVWDLNDATVLCRQLGYELATDASSNFYFDNMQWNIYRYDFKCKGSEWSLEECPVYVERNMPLCDTMEHAEVVCDSPGDDTMPIKLTESDDNSEGKLKVFHNRRWGFVCDQGWTIHEADVICRQLGFSAGAMTLNGLSVNSDFITSIGPYVINRVRCQGNEEDINKCFYSSMENNDEFCIGEEVYVKCKHGEHIHHKRAVMWISTFIIVILFILVLATLLWHRRRKDKLDDKKQLIENQFDKISQTFSTTSQTVTKDTKVPQQVIFGPTAVLYLNAQNTPKVIFPTFNGSNNTQQPVIITKQPETMTSATQNHQILDTNISLSNQLRDDPDNMTSATQNQQNSKSSSNLSRDENQDISNQSRDENHDISNQSRDENHDILKQSHDGGNEKGETVKPLEDKINNSPLLLSREVTFGDAKTDSNDCEDDTATC